jgi:hypothetical protein
MANLFTWLRCVDKSAEKNVHVKTAPHPDFSVGQDAGRSSGPKLCGAVLWDIERAL